MGGKMLIRNVKSKAEKWFRSLRDAVASKITTKRERPMLATEAEKFDAKWSMSSQSSLDHRRDFEADPSNDNVPCTCEVEFMLPEDDDAGSDSSEIRGYWKLSNESCTVRPYAQLDQAALQRSYRKLEAGCLHFSLIKGNGKAGAKLIGWNIELTRINVAMMKASQEFKSAVWLDLCRRHNTDRWVRKYFVWTWNIHDQDHVDRVYKSLIKNSGCSNATVNSEWDTVRCLGDAERDHGRYITRAQLFPEIHFVEHDNDVEEQKYVELCYSFPRRGNIPFMLETEATTLKNLVKEEYATRGFLRTHTMETGKLREGSIRHLAAASGNAHLRHILIGDNGGKPLITSVASTS